MPPSRNRSARRGPFAFVGGLLALDLLNTRVDAPAEPREFLRDTSDLAAWAEAAELPYALSLRNELRGRRGNEILATVRQLREIIRGGVEAWRLGELDSALLEALNVALARAPRFLQLRRTRQGIRRAFISRATSVDRLFADVARSATRLVLDHDPHRCKQCEGPTCSVVFYDASKPGTRRWCSMELCGKDAKIRALSSRRIKTGRRHD